MNPIFWLLPLAALAESTTMLSQAELLSEMYSQEIAKAPPPSPFPATDAGLLLSSVWFSVDLKTVAVPKEGQPLDLFREERIWNALRDLGVNGLFIQGLRKSGSLGIDPRWGNNWPQIEEQAQTTGITLIGDLIGNATAPGLDFQQGLQKKGDCTSLYQLIEVNPSDWALLPNPAPGCYETNIPWLTIQELYKKGYIPEKFNPYIKESAWNATVKIRGVDNKMRRWIYLKEGENRPVLAWFSPSFAAYRLLAGDALQASFQLGQRILRLDGAIPPIAQENLSLWVRKIGAYSAVTTDGTLASLKSVSADLAYDTATKPALLHALIAEDAEALRMIYRLFLELEISPKRLIHALEPFDESVCDWVELMQNPRKKFLYKDEQITGEILRRRLLKEDLVRLGTSERIPPSTWVDFCARSLGVKEFEKHRDQIAQAHLLLAFAYAMQPGAFSFSLADLLGALPGQMENLDLFEPNPQTLYSSLPTQLRNPSSFASQLKNILTAREESNIARGELIAVLPSPNPGTLLLLHRLPETGFSQLLALNFSKRGVTESIARTEICNTTAIDLMSHLAEEKVFSAHLFSFNIPPVSGRAFYFQPKYY